MTTIEQNKMMLDERKDKIGGQPQFKEGANSWEKMDSSSKKTMDSSSNFQNKLGRFDQELEGDNKNLENQVALTNLDQKSKAKVDGWFKVENGKDQFYKTFAQVVNERYSGVVGNFKTVKDFQNWFNNLHPDLQDSYYSAFEEGVVEKKWLTAEQTEYLKQKLSTKTGNKESYFKFKNMAEVQRTQTIDSGQPPVENVNTQGGLTPLEKQTINTDMQQQGLDTMSGN